MTMIPRQYTWMILFSGTSARLNKRSCIYSNTTGMPLTDHTICSFLFMLLISASSEYQLTATGACFRTEVAACMKYMTRRDWRNYVLGHSTKGVNAAKTEKAIQEWIQIYAKEADATIAALRSSSEHQIYTHKTEVLLKRWNQIKCLCGQALEHIAN